MRSRSVLTIGKGHLHCWDALPEHAMEIRSILGNGRTKPVVATGLLIYRSQPIDFTVLDHHFGTITQWREAIEKVHSRGMYVLLDITGAT